MSRKTWYKNGFTHALLHWVVGIEFSEGRRLPEISLNYPDFQGCCENAPMCLLETKVRGPQGDTALLVNPPTIPMRTFSLRLPQKLMFCPQKGKLSCIFLGEVFSIQHGVGFMGWPYILWPAWPSVHLSEPPFLYLQHGYGAPTLHVKGGSKIANVKCLI